MSDRFAYITADSVYAVIDGRWVKTTDLRPGHHSDLEGGWETLERLRHGSPASGWVDCLPGEVASGARARLTSRNFDTVTEPVLAVLDGSDYDLGVEERIDRPETSVVLARSEAFIVAAGSCLRLLPDGARQPVSRRAVIPHLRWAIAFTAAQ